MSETQNRACAALSDFIANVKSQSGKAVDPATAAGLTADASTIKQQIGCSK